MEPRVRLFAEVSSRVNRQSHRDADEPEGSFDPAAERRGREAPPRGRGTQPHEDYGGTVKAHSPHAGPVLRQRPHSRRARQRCRGGESAVAARGAAVFGDKRHRCQCTRESGGNRASPSQGCRYSSNGSWAARGNLTFVRYPCCGVVDRLPQGGIADCGYVPIPIKSPETNIRCH